MQYTEEYDSGSTCFVTQKPRRIKLSFFCDEYAGEQNHINDDLDINGRNHLEPFLNESEALMNFTRGELNNLLSYQRDFKLIELSEPDWCVYHAKIATRFMCGAHPDRHI